MAAPQGATTFIPYNLACAEPSTASRIPPPSRCRISVVAGLRYSEHALSRGNRARSTRSTDAPARASSKARSEEHTSELQSPYDPVCPAPPPFPYTPLFRSPAGRDHFHPVHLGVRRTLHRVEDTPAEPLQDFRGRRAQILGARFVAREPGAVDEEHRCARAGEQQGEIGRAHV